MPGASPTPDPAKAAESLLAQLIGRPVLALVLNALVILAGLAALLAIEVRELPQVDNPVITVTTSYDGATPETIDREITETVEGAVSRVSGVRTISSSSRFGTSRVTIEFQDDTNIDRAATDVRDALVRIARNLPDGAEDPRAVKADTNGETVIRLVLTSPSRSSQELTDLAETLLDDRLLAIEGVADVQLSGNRDAIVGVDVDLLRLASRGLTLADLGRSLTDVGIDVPAGALGSDRQTLLIRTRTALGTPAELESLQVAPNVRLGDVAQVFFGPEPGTSYLRTNGENGIGLAIIRQAESNNLAISTSVAQLVDEVQPLLPGDTRLFVSYDAATFVRGALHEIVRALGLSVLIVALIIQIFLRDLRATLIPVVAIPVSLVGTLAALWIAGFSINILTLLALVLATGLVVDDAIVVLENIARRRAEGMGARAAAVLGTRQVFFAVLATTTTLAAVFVPLAFLPGQTGRLFREFGFTLAISVALSAFVALSLCPVLAARLLAGDTAGQQRESGIGTWLSRFYARTLRDCLNAPLPVLVFSALFLATAWMVQGGLKRELTPPEDRSVILMSILAPQAVSLDYTAERMQQIEDRLAPLRATGEVTSIFAVAGQGAENRGFMVLSLADWSARTRSQQDIAAEVARLIAPVIGLRATTIQPNSLGIRGAGQGLSFAVVGTDYSRLAEAATTLSEKMQDDGAFGQVRVAYDLTQPQLLLDVDRARAADIGIDLAVLGPTLQAVLDGRTVGQVFQDGKSYDVRLLSRADPINDPGDLERIFARASDGQMVPLSAFVTLKEQAVAAELGREGLMRSVPMSASLGPDIAVGAAFDRAEQLAADILPAGYHLAPLAEARTLRDSAAGTLVTFGFALALVFLVLAAQFESMIAALIVMATVPLGLASAAFALRFTGGSLNLYSQIGLVLLVGVMAKNAILIVEFAGQLRDQGATVRDAIEKASLTRLRPVAMTMIATVLGALPLVLASGAGAEARAVLGWVILGGLGLATLATLYVTPVAFLLLAGLSRPRAATSALIRKELHESHAEIAVQTESERPGR
ncbi:MAG TPA: efflux RND transporter permease subunit [Paracoccaceae bacterium]|nr:efflux RND transporter permease subunit [Paracoccaceae bacterium]